MPIATQKGTPRKKEQAGQPPRLPFPTGRPRRFGISLLYGYRRHNSRRYGRRNADIKCINDRRGDIRRGHIRSKTSIPEKSQMKNKQKITPKKIRESDSVYVAASSHRPSFKH
ncbi:MAG: hypothetical protein IJK98_03815 [Clostridia bacterium]|nr:hypothetical protein [Clostridia bacterium]